MAATTSGCACAQNQRAPGANDNRCTRGRPHPRARARRAIDDQRVAAHGAKGAHRAVHAADQNLLRALENSEDWLTLKSFRGTHPEARYMWSAAALPPLFAARLAGTCSCFVRTPRIERGEPRSKTAGASSRAPHGLCVLACEHTWKNNAGRIRRYTQQCFSQRATSLA